MGPLVRTLDGSCSEIYKELQANNYDIITWDLWLDHNFCIHLVDTEIFISWPWLLKQNLVCCHEHSTLVGLRFDKSAEIKYIVLQVDVVYVRTGFLYTSNPDFVPLKSRSGQVVSSR